MGKVINTTTGNLQRYSKDTLKEIKSLVADITTQIEIDATRDAPRFTDTGEGSKTEGDIFINIDKKFTDNGYTGEVGVMGENNMAAYLEFGTGLSAGEILAPYPQWIKDIAWKFFVTGQGTLKGKPYLYPNVLKGIPVFQKELKTLIDKDVKTMDRATYIRGEVISKLTGLKHLGVAIPVFDEFVNPNATIPSVGGAQEIYIILQDQQTNMNAVQTVCAPRFNLSMTIRIVTKWGLTGSKKLCEDIGDTVINLLRDDRGASKIDGISKVELVTARSISEVSQTNIAFSKILILNFIKMDNYQPGWKNARMAYWDGLAYIPIACITSRSEANASNVTEKVNACTQGKTVKTISSITRTQSVSGDVVDADSLDELRVLQDSLEAHTFMVYRTSGVDGATETPEYFVATIENLNAGYPTGEGESATFTMDLSIDGDYTLVDPNEEP